MRFIIKKTRRNIIDLLRGVGYHFQREDKNNREIVLYRPFTSYSFPRFHLYLKIEDNDFIFNLHLDHKKPIYKGVPAHSAEYSGPLVEKEVERIKNTLLSQ